MLLAFLSLCDTVFLSLAHIHTLCLPLSQPALIGNFFYTLNRQDLCPFRLNRQDQLKSQADWGGLGVGFASLLSLGTHSNEPISLGSLVPSKQPLPRNISYSISIVPSEQGAMQAYILLQDPSFFCWFWIYRFFFPFATLWSKQTQWTSPFFLYFFFFFNIARIFFSCNKQKLECMGPGSKRVIVSFSPRLNKRAQGLENDRLDKSKY